MYILFPLYLGQVSPDSSLIEHPFGKDLTYTRMVNNKYSLPVKVVELYSAQDINRILNESNTTPNILKVFSVDTGLNISWQAEAKLGQIKSLIILQSLSSSGEKTAVSKQKIANSSVNIEDYKRFWTNDTQLLVGNLVPGALYSVQVMSVSRNGTHSVSQQVHQVVRPLPPSNVTARYVNESSIALSWDTPHNSFVSGYYIRYKAEHTGTWMQPTESLMNGTRQELTNLLPGEKYTIELSSVSFSVLCAAPVQVHWYTPPSPVQNVAALPSMETVKLKFQKPQSRFDFYKIRWKYSDTYVSERKLVPPDSSEEFVTVLIEELTPGVMYEFSIASVSYNVESKARMLSACTWPQIDELIVMQSASVSTSLVINYTSPMMIHFDLFRFQISLQDELDHSPLMIIEKQVNDSDTGLTFDSLYPGNLYLVTVWTVSGEVTSAPTERLHRLRPNPVTNVSRTHVSNATVTLSWKFPDKFRVFEVEYDQVTLRTANSFITIRGLRPYQNYTFSVSVISGEDDLLPTRSLPVNLTVETLSSVPGRVSEFYAVDIQPRNITFTWSLPESDRHGVLTKFTLHYMVEGNSSSLTSKDFKSEDNRGVITGLVPSTSYIVRVRARTMVGYGPAASSKVETLPLPGVRVFPAIDLKTSRTVRVKFHKNFFPEEFGPIISYTLIIAENSTNVMSLDNIAGLNTFAWRDVQSLTPWPPYQVLEPREFFMNRSVEYFTIGSEECLPSVNFCNGPLKSGTSYRVKLRAFTHLKPDRYSDTMYSFPITTNKDYTVPVILSLVLASILSPVLIVFYRRHFHKKQDQNTSDTSLKIFSHPIPVACFKTMLVEPCKISREFESLKSVGKGQSTSAAELAINRPKNRFSNILPYDVSRYKLQPVDDEEGSDYVNASYIPGPASPRHYIATQGPLAGTQNDFWRLCWECRTPAVVMLTQCEEGGRTKCHRYWPLGERVLRCGGVDVHTLGVQHYAAWSLTQLLLRQGGEQRTLTHWHFTSWPDFGVPQPPDSLVRFLLAFRARVSPAQQPVMVHCSAGVGRTGTFIALDSVVQELHNSEVAGSVDILGVVHRLRKARMCMVQTQEQYTYIYQCVKLLLQGVTQTPERQIHDNPGFEPDEGVEDLK